MKSSPANGRKKSQRWNYYDGRRWNWLSASHTRTRFVYAITIAIFYIAMSMVTMSMLATNTNAYQTHLPTMNCVTGLIASHMVSLDRRTIAHWLLSWMKRAVFANEVTKVYLLGSNIIGNWPRRKSDKFMINLNNQPRCALIKVLVMADVDNTPS